jgi:hypothetical protein
LVLAASPSALLPSCWTCLATWQPGLRGAVSDGSPLLDPRCLRWIIRELAAAQVAGQAAGRSRREPAALAHETIARVLFPVTLEANSWTFPFREVMRAIWLLHEGFQLGDNTAAEADRPMSILAAYSYGVQQSSGMLRFLDRGGGCWKSTTPTRPLAISGRSRACSARHSLTRPG